MEEIILHMIIIAPITRWLMGSKRIWNKGKREYGIYLSLLLIFCVGIYELKKSEQNYYEILNLNSYASKVEIQQSFRKLSRIYHPDKNKEFDSLDHFNKIREAYEVLVDDKKKYYYDRFGDFTESEVTNFFYVEMVIISIFHYAISFIFGFLFTYGKENEKYRMIICLYITLNFCFEIIYRFSQESNIFLSKFPIFCHFTPFERIHAFKVLVPLVMNAVLLIDIYFFDDDTDYLITISCEHAFKMNCKSIKNLEDAVIFCARLIDGKIDPDYNFSWREEKAHIQIKNVYELEDEHIYDKKYDKDDIFYSLLYEVIEQNKNQIDMKIPKKELCSRFDWSRWHVDSVIEKIKEEKKIIDNNTSKGIIISSVLYFFGLIAHLLSK